MSALEEAAFALCDGLDAHLPMAHGHSRAAAELAQRVARELGLDDETIGRCQLGALVHDVGMLALDAGVVSRPSPPTEEEWRALEMHPIAGERLLRTIPQLASLAPAVRAHHERVDGSGYPDRLRGGAIPLEARVIAVVDAFDAMTALVPFRRRFTKAEALAELIGNSGTQFDADVVEALATVFGRRARRLRLVSSA